jgi:hypothetical protein
LSFCPADAASFKNGTEMLLYSPLFLHAQNLS